MALNARRVSTRSTLNLWRSQGMACTHITLSIRLCPSHRHFPKKLVFSPATEPDCHHAWGTLTEVVLTRAFSAVLSCRVHCGAHIGCVSRGGAVSECHSFASRGPMFPCFGEKVQDKPRKLLLASIKPPRKFKAFHKV